MMRYIKSGSDTMSIEEYAAKKQGRIDSGRDVVVGVNRYLIDEDDGDRNRDGNKGGEDAADALRINNAAVRESQIQRLGEPRSNREESEVREALNRIKRSAALSKDYENNNNGINKSNNGKTVTETLGGEGGRRLPPARAIIPIIYQGCPWRQRPSNAHWGRYCTRRRRYWEGTYFPPPPYLVRTSPPFSAVEERATIKGEGRRRKMTTMTTTMMAKKTNRNKNRENIDPCDNLYQTSRWSTAIGCVYWWSIWVRTVTTVDQGS